MPAPVRQQANRGVVDLSYFVLGADQSCQSQRSIPETAGQREALCTRVVNEKARVLSRAFASKRSPPSEFDAVFGQESIDQNAAESSRDFGRKPLPSGRASHR